MKNPGPRWAGKVSSTVRPQPSRNALFLFSFHAFPTDPDLDGSFSINRGLRVARQLLLDINKLGVPAGVEYLDVISPQYISDLVHKKMKSRKTKGNKKKNGKKEKGKKKMERRNKQTKKIGKKKKKIGRKKIKEEWKEPCRHFVTKLNLLQVAWGAIGGKL